MAKRARYNRGNKNKNESGQINENGNKNGSNRDKKREVENGFLSLTPCDDGENWIIEDYAKYKKAIFGAVEKVPIPENGILDFQEIWFNSSLPPDLIMEIIKENGLSDFKEIRKITLNGETVWTRNVSEDTNSVDSGEEESI